VEVINLNLGHGLIWPDWGLLWFSSFLQSACCHFSFDCWHSAIEQRTYAQTAGFFFFL